MGKEECPPIGLSDEVETKAPSYIQASEHKWFLNTIPYTCRQCHKHIPKLTWHLHEPIKFAGSRPKSK